MKEIPESGILPLQTGMATLRARISPDGCRRRKPTLCWLEIQRWETLGNA
jgi:hypothetical protein